MRSPLLPPSTDTDHASKQNSPTCPDLPDLMSSTLPRMRAQCMQLRYRAIYLSGYESDILDELAQDLGIFYEAWLVKNGMLRFDDSFSAFQYMVGLDVSKWIHGVGGANLPEMTEDMLFLIFATFLLADVELFADPASELISGDNLFECLDYAACCAASAARSISHAMAIQEQKSISSPGSDYSSVGANHNPGSVH